MTDQTKTALLSKLRAPVADERALTEEKRKEFIRRTSYISEADRDTRAAFVDEIARATLASAPVAGEAVQLLRSIREQDYLSDTMRHRIDRLLTNAAPQASAELWRASDADALAWADRHNVEAVLKCAETARCAIDDARSLHMLTTPAPQACEAVELLRKAAEALAGYRREMSLLQSLDEQPCDAEKAILAVLSAQPPAEPLSNPKQFVLTAADERTAFEATYQADYDDPGAACEREHFGKGYRAGLSAQSAEKPAISSPSSAGNRCPELVPAYPETGNSHTDGGAVYG